MPLNYDQQFFAEQRDQGMRSARVVVPIVVDLLQPQSVVDVGCGVGAWLAAFNECGISDTLGIDGDWAAQFFELGSSTFLKHDLSVPIELNRRFDLAVCLEVAEHLPPACAADFVKSLTRLADVILFSAAVPLQGGTLHLNEQWPEFWARLFALQDYRTIDAVRPRIWSNPTVDWWYAQNALLFVHSDRSSSLASLSGSRMADQIAPLSVVHPRHYLEKARLANIGLREALTMIPGLARDALGRRFFRVREAFSRPTRV